MREHHDDIETLLRAYQQFIDSLSYEAYRAAQKAWEADRVGALSASGFERLVGGFKEQGVAGGQAFYQLVRALEYGQVFGRAPGQTTLAPLVKAFSEATGIVLKLKANGGLTFSVVPPPVSPVSADKVVALEVEKAARRMSDWLKVKAVSAKDGPTYTRESELSVFQGLAQMAVANTARSTVAAMGRVDKKRKRWMRVSMSGDPCAFCAMLISRGAVYTSSFNDPAQAWHPHCKCVTKPAFGEAQPASVIDQADKFLQRWEEARGDEGRLTAASWRRWYYKHYKR